MYDMSLRFLWWRHKKMDWDAFRNGLLGALVMMRTNGRAALSRWTRRSKPGRGFRARQHLRPRHRTSRAVINDIASIYLARHEAAGNPSDLHVALVYLQRLVADAERGSPLRCSALTNLSRALVARSYSTGHRADLDAAVAAQVAGIEEASADAPERPGYHNNLGLALMARYGLTGDVQDLERATEAFSLALKEPVGSVHRPGSQRGSRTRAAG